MRVPNMAALLAGAALLSLLASAVAKSYVFRAKALVEPVGALAFAPASADAPGTQVASSPDRMGGQAGKEASVSGGE